MSFTQPIINISVSYTGCKKDNATVVLKYGGLPVINPDNTKFPPTYYLSNRPEIYTVNLESNSAAKYINLTSPRPGSYFAVAYFPYVNPNDIGITQEGEKKATY